MATPFGASHLAIVVVGLFLLAGSATALTCSSTLATEVVDRATPASQLARKPQPNRKCAIAVQPRNAQKKVNRPLLENQALVQVDRSRPLAKGPRVGLSGHREVTPTGNLFLRFGDRSRTKAVLDASDYQGVETRRPGNRPVLAGFWKE